jgi:hemerythrin
MLCERGTRLYLPLWICLMTLLHWNKDYSLGVAMIDRDHQQLFTLINEFHNAFAEKHEAKDIARVLNALIQYSEAHFRREEEFMSNEAYPELVQHQEIHYQLIDSVFQLQTQFEKKSIQLSNNTVKFLRHWLGDHILEHDKKFAHFLANKRKAQSAGS